MGLILRAVMAAVRSTYVDRATLQSISGTADVLIVAGIASIQPHVVASFGIELAMLFIFGLD